MTGTKRRGIVLQRRDRRLLQHMALMRVMDREDAECLGHFRSVTRANARLLQLTGAGLLTRLPFGTRLCGQKFLYALTRAGAQAINTTYRAPLWPAYATLAWNPTLEHQLLVNRLYRDLNDLIRHGRGYLSLWRTFSEPWSTDIRVIPDAYAEITTDTHRHAVFFELDRGTETTKVWTRKVEQYLALARSGDVERRFQHSRFKVAVLLPSRRRLESIRRVVAQQTTKVFWFAAPPDGAGTVSVNDPVWLRPIGDDTHPLF